MDRQTQDDAAWHRRKVASGMKRGEGARCVGPHTSRRGARYDESQRVRMARAVGGNMNVAYKRGPGCARLVSWRAIGAGAGRVRSIGRTDEGPSSRGCWENVGRQQEEHLPLHLALPHLWPSGFVGFFGFAGFIGFVITGGPSWR